LIYECFVRWLNPHTSTPTAANKAQITSNFTGSVLLHIITHESRDPPWESIKSSG